jgi:mRNA interferase RelE/StbE
MEYDVRFGSRALKDLRRLDKKMSKRIVDRIEMLTKDLAGDVKKLTEYSPQYRLRVGIFEFFLTSMEKRFSFSAF